jgi:cation diffusion facilitator CzcD-associated flavoprotein CzcO
MTFRTECESASWDNERQRWSVLLRDLETGKTYVHECKVLFSAVGWLVDPKHPNIHGMNTFEGPVFHTARWRHDVGLEGKDTVVIGNGCEYSPG